MPLHPKIRMAATIIITSIIIIMGTISRRRTETGDWRPESKVKSQKSKVILRWENGSRNPDSDGQL